LLNIIGVTIGIEKYENPDWRLEKVSNDLVCFLSYLSEIGVPKDNCIVYANGKNVKDNKFSYSNTSENTFKCSEPTSDNIVKLFTTILPVLAKNKKPDYVWVHWSGHGVMADDNTRRLIASNANVDAAFNIDIEDVMKYMKTDIRYGNIKQIFTIDACTTNADKIRNLKIGDRKIAGANQEVDGNQIVQQYFIGIPLGNETRDGALTQTLLEGMRKYHLCSNGYWNPNIDEVRRCLDATKIEISKNGSYWDDRRNISIDTQKALDKLVNNITQSIDSNKDILKESADRLISFFARKYNIPVGGDLAQEVFVLANNLIELNESNNEWPFYLFCYSLISLISEYVDTRDYHAKLDNISAMRGYSSYIESFMSAARSYIDQNLKASALNSDPLIFIEVMRSDVSLDKYSFVAKTWQQGIGIICSTKPSDPLPLNEIQAPISLEVEKLYKELNSTQPLIEFCVPADLLCVPFDQWQIGTNIGTQFEEIEIISKVAEVRVRLWDRCYGKLDLPLVKRWHSKCNKLPTSSVHRFVTATDFDNAIDSEIKDKKAIVLGVGLHNFKDKDCRKRIKKIIDNGYPVALWPRTELESSHNLLVNAHIVSELNEQVTDLRRSVTASSDGNNIGGHLTLLWDDCNHMPPKAAQQPSPTQHH